MVNTLKVETQGVSDDWVTANGDFTTKLRGKLNEPQLLIAMLHLAPLDTPETDDPCPPHILVKSNAGIYSFIGQGGSIFCPEADQEMTPHQATDLAFGKISVAPPPPMPATPQPSTPNAASLAASPTIQKRKFGLGGGIVLFLSLCFLLGAIVMVFGVFSMLDRGMPQDDVLSAITITGGMTLIGVLMFLIALKARRTQHYDKHGMRVNEDGSALPFIMMAQSSLEFDDDYDDFDGDFD